MSYCQDAMPVGAATAMGGESRTAPVNRRARSDHTTTPGTLTLGDIFSGRAEPCRDLKARAWVKWDQLRAVLTRAARHVDRAVIDEVWEKVLDDLDASIAHVDRVLSEAREGVPS